MKTYAGKIAFITGGASGAGLGQAKLFGGLGAKVTIVDIRQEAIDKALAELKELGVDAVGYQMDLTNREQYIATADKAEQHWGGPPHLLFNTAGVNSFGPAEASTFEDYDWILGVNLYGVINGLVIFVPRMIKAYGGKDGVAKEEAHVCIVSSMGAFDGFSTDTPYSVSKAAVNNLAYSYYDALKPYGIGVTVQCPANINSNIGEAVRTRPAHLQNTGYYVSEGTINMLKSIHAQGIDPIRLAEGMKFGIDNGLPMVIPYYGEADGPLNRALDDSSFKKFIQFTSVEGMKQYGLDQEEQRKRMEEARKSNPNGRWGAPPEGVVVETFGQARADLDFVDPSKRKQ